MQFQISSKKLYKPFSNDLDNPNIKFFIKKILGEDKEFFLTAIVYAVAIAILSLATPISVQLLINSVAFTAMLKPILILGFLLFLLLSFSAILNVLQFYISEIFQRKFFARMSADITLATVKARHENFEESNQTEFVNRFFDVITIQKSLPKILIKSFTLVLQTIAGLILVAFYHPILLVFSLLIIISIILIWQSFCKKGFITKFYSSRRKYDMAGWLEDIARNNSLFKSEIGQKYAIFKTDFLTEQYLEERKSHFSQLFAQFSLMLALYAVASSLLLIIGGYLVTKGQLSIGQLVASELILSTTLYGISQLGRDFETFYDIVGACEKLSQFYNIPLENTGAEKIDTDHIDIKFNHVVDIYFEREFKFNFSLKHHKNYIISTHNLSSQKVLIELLYCLRKPVRGTLEFNNIEIENIDIANLRSKIALIDNSSFIEGNIEEYLTFNNKNISKKLINEVLQITGLDKALQRFNEGLNLRIIPTGYPLSESEKILLKISRALLQEPKIIIITEVLDMLGLKTRQNMIKFLTKNHNSTVIYFSNRRDDMHDFDEYIFIDEDRTHNFKSIDELDKFEQKNG
jgi:ABC-type bacteriocin/lantibiotic exporter with double-glycine peptidase domain